MLTGFAMCAALALPATAQAQGSHHGGGHHGRQHTWYVSASAAPGGDGSRHAPFNELAQVQQASGPGDTIVVEPAPLSVPPLDGGIALQDGQRLIGGGPAVVRPGSPVLAGGPSTTVAASLPELPRITNTSGATNSGDVVELANHTTVANLVFAGAFRGGMYGNDVSDVTIRGNDLTDFDTSATTGFTVLHGPGGTYTAGEGLNVPVPSGWAAIMFDATTARGSVTVDDNYLHDGACGDGVDVRTMGTADISEHVAHNFFTRLLACAETGGFVDTVQAISTQPTGTSRLRVDLNSNTESDLGVPDGNPEGLFVNPGDSAQLTETVEHNADLNQIGGSSSNGLEFLLGSGDANAFVKVTDSVFDGDPGDMIEEFNRGVDSTTTLILDHVTVRNTTLTAGLPPYGDPAGTATIPDNGGQCVNIVPSGGGDVTVMDMRDSSLSGCDNNGLEMTSNHVTGLGDDIMSLVSLNIDHSTITGSRYYNLWLNNLTPLNTLRVRVQDTDLTGSSSGIAAGLDQQPTGSTTSSDIDLGGGALGSRGGNCISGGALADLEATSFSATAEHDWWGTAAGPQAGTVVANAGSTLDVSAPLTHEPGACRGF